MLTKKSEGYHQFNFTLKKINKTMKNCKLKIEKAYNWKKSLRELPPSSKF